MAGDGNVLHRCLDEGIEVAANVYSLVLLGGNPKLGYPGLDDANAFLRRSTSWGSFLEQQLDGGDLWRGGVHLPRRRRQVSAMWRSEALVTDVV
jgi:hypothetical protein